MQTQMFPTHTARKLKGVVVHFPMVKLTYEDGPKPLYFVVRDPDAQQRILKLVREWIGLK